MTAGGFCEEAIGIESLCFYEGGAVGIAVANDAAYGLTFHKQIGAGVADHAGGFRLEGSGAEDLGGSIGAGEGAAAHAGEIDGVILKSARGDGGEKLSEPAEAAADDGEAGRGIAKSAGKGELIVEDREGVLIGDRKIPVRLKGALFRGSRQVRAGGGDVEEVET